MYVYLYLTFQDGIWNFHIKTAGNASLPLPSKSSPKSGEISVVVYGSKATKGPIELSNQDRQLLLRGKVDHFEVRLMF